MWAWVAHAWQASSTLAASAVASVIVWSTVPYSTPGSAPKVSSSTYTTFSSVPTNTVAVQLMVTTAVVARSERVKDRHVAVRTGVCTLIVVLFSVGSEGTMHTNTQRRNNASTSLYGRAFNTAGRIATVGSAAGAACRSSASWACLWARSAKGDHGGDAGDSDNGSGNGGNGNAVAGSDGGGRRSGTGMCHPSGG